MTRSIICMRRRLVAACFFAAMFPWRAVAASPVGDSNDLSDAELQQITQALQADIADQESSTPPDKAPGWQATARNLVQSMNPDMSLVLDTALAAFNTEEPMQLGGHDPRHAGFNLQQAELYLGANVDPFFRLDGNFVFTLEGVEIEEAFATTTALPANLQVRAGQFLTRFGRLNSTHPHEWHFVDQPLVLGKFFGGDGNRGLGAELGWLSTLPWYLEVIVAANNAGGACCGRSYFVAADDAVVRTPADLQWTAAVKQFFPLARDWSLLWGLSAQTGPNQRAGRTAIYGTDLYVRWRPLVSENRQAVSLQIESILRERRAGSLVLRDAGGYAQLVWNINPSWELGGRGELVSGFDNDYLDKAWTGNRSRYAAQLTYYPSHFARIRLQGTAGQAVWVENPILGAFLALEVVTGAHGAHSY